MQHRPRPPARRIAPWALAAFLGGPLVAAPQGPARITQDQVTSGDLSLHELRQAGLRMFAGSFDRSHGFGDGPMDPVDPTTPGGRPTLGGNGTFLRANGLDAQSCFECHAVVSNATLPPTMGVGGAGASSSNVMAGPRTIDIDDEAQLGFAQYDGRFINPPFLFGAGGVELVGKEMTRDLQLLRALAEANPGSPVPLVTKGVDFGTLTFTGRGFDTSGVVGVDADLVVKPFGRKGTFPTTRAFDVEAFPFHFGMQPVEKVGAGVDEDGDGVVDEVLVGELSALEIFNTTLAAPEQRGGGAPARFGEKLFGALGCAGCHVPELHTETPWLPLAFPEVPAQPFANAYLDVDLSAVPGFAPSPQGGVRVPLFSDLKRHDLGPELAETTGDGLDAWFLTARLWGVADTAPYLHDGRALTLQEAILMHGGEAQAARDAYAALTEAKQEHVLAFLRSLRTPEGAAEELFE